MSSRVSAKWRSAGTRSGQLLTLRRELGLTQAEVAARMGTSQLRVERRGGRPRRPALHRGALLDGARRPAGTGGIEQEVRWLPDAGLTGAGRGPEALSDVVARRVAQRVVLAGPGRMTSPSPCGGRADDARCRGRRRRDPARRLRGGRARPSLTLMDVIELMGVPVRALCLGLPGSHRCGGRLQRPFRPPQHAFSLSEPTTELQAHVRNITQWAELRRAERERFCRIASAPPPVRTRPRSSMTLSGGASSVRRRRWPTAFSTRCPDPRPGTAVARNGSAAHGVPAGALIGA